MDQELNCIISLISLLNFNQEIPENHNFCTTVLNDKYISTINTETLEIEKQRKKGDEDNRGEIGQSAESSYLLTFSS